MSVVYGLYEQTSPDSSDCLLELYESEEEALHEAKKCKERFPNHYYVESLSVIPKQYPKRVMIITNSYRSRDDIEVFQNLDGSFSVYSDEISDLHKNTKGIIRQKVIDVYTSGASDESIEYLKRFYDWYKIFFYENGKVKKVVDASNRY